MRRTVLIVDDHPAFRASARLVLENDGFDVVGEAGDGASALAAIEELRPEIVLLDVQLPDMTGFDVCALAGTPGGPSVVLVSSRDATDYADLITCGARGFIPKAELTGQALEQLVAR